LKAKIQMVQEIASSKRSLASLAFWFWTLTIFRFAFALLFFRDSPVTATAVGSVLSVGFAYLILIWFLRTDILGTTAFRWPPIVKWIGLYVAWCAISLYWTRSASLISASGYWVTMTLDLFIVGAMLKWGDTGAVVLASLKGIVVGCGAIAVAALIFSSSSSSDGRLGDLDFLHPTSVGNFASVGTLCSVYFWWKARGQAGRERWYWAGFATFLAVILILTVSKTSMIALTFAFAFFLLSSGMPRKTKIIVLLLGTALFAVMYASVSSYITDYEANTREITTLTGRTVLWAKAWEMIEDHPVVGYGFLSFRDYGPQDWDVRTSHGHDEWITQWFQLGGVGVLLTFAIYASYFWCFWRSPRSLQRQFGLSLLIYMLIEGFTIAEPIGLMFPLTMMLLLTVWITVSTGLKSTEVASTSTNPMRPLSLLRQPSC
jgi:exopolysaccharide production protein ExoQ